ncbi:hypothetical protein Ac2012v2_004206 [Leucoagaricus gongylophorus]
MSQHTNSQSDASSLHYHRCWWSWCRHNFYTKQDLLNHVISEHVQKASPVRLADIHTAQTAENSYWDSLDFGSLPSLPSNLPDQGENHSQASSHCQIDIPSSLPSPPASLPQDTITPILRQPPTGLSVDDEPLQVAPASSSPHTPFPKRNTSDAHLDTPSFASLSSQPNSPNNMSYDVPSSPCFDLLVASATSWSKHPVLPLPENSEEKSQELESRSSNKDSVMDLDSNDAVLQLEPHSSYFCNQEPSLLPVQILPTISSSSPSYLHSSVCPSMTPVARQSWYQPQRRRPSHKSASDASVGYFSPATSPMTKAVTLITSPIPANSLPAAVQAAQSVASQNFQPAPQSQFQEQSSDSSQPSSYPLLTQAPLRSQSLIQD